MAFSTSLSVLACGSLVSAAAINTLSSTTAAAATYTQVADFSGSNFFDGFEAYTGADPTNGHVNYTDMATAASLGLLGFNQYAGAGNATHAYIGVDATNPAPKGRNSVRLTSKATFSVGMLAIMDFHHVPTGFGVWPAAWFLGTGGVWPSKGEIDVLEYVHNASGNAVTLHTAAGCGVQNSMKGNEYVGALQNGDCNAGNAGEGCSVHAPATVPVFKQDVATAGVPLNAQNGGIYVTEWTTAGIKVWAFSRDAVPQNLNLVNPSTAGFPTPITDFSGDGCDFSTTFQDVVLILNTDFCGDWAGKVWESSGAAAATGVETCNDYVANHPKAFENAYWDIGGIKIFSSGAQPGVNPEKRDVAETEFTRNTVLSTSSTTSSVPKSMATMINKALNAPALGLMMGNAKTSGAAYHSCPFASVAGDDCGEEKSRFAIYATVFGGALLLAGLL